MKQKNYFQIQLFLILIFVFIGLYFSQKYNIPYAKIAIRFIYRFLLLFLLYKRIGLDGFKYFKYLLISIVIDTFIIPFFYIPEIPLGTVIGAYLYIIPVLLLFFQIYNYESNRLENGLINQLLILFILFIVFIISYLIFIESIISIAIIAIIINLVIISILLGLTFSLKMDLIPKILYFSGTFSLLLSVIIASYLNFTPNFNFKINISIYLKILSYYFFILAMYFQNKIRLESNLVA